MGRVPKLVRAPRARSLGTELLRVVLVVAALVAGAWLWPTSVGGGTALITTHGTSMEPRFHTGDLAVMHASDHFQVGDVVAYHSDQLKTVVMHRIVARDGSAFVFKGDNNSFLDPDHPAPEQLIGKLAVRVPQGGIWLARLTSPAALAGITFSLLGAGGAAAQTRRRRRRNIVPRPAPRPARLASRVAELPPQLRTAVTAVAALGVAALIVGLASWAGPLTSSTAVKDAGGGSLIFSYTAAVPRSPAYDSTTATSPDPVFRKLTNKVDVHVTYQGRPGTIAVTGELSTPSGWRTTFPLAPSTPFRTSRYAAEVHLDLAALDARVQAAAVATGLPADQISLQVTPTIRTAGTKTFQPSLKLVLSPLQLRLADDSSSLRATDATQVKAKAARTLEVLGHHVSVAAARSLSLVLLLLSLVLGAVVLVVARRTAPVSEAAGIHRRYGAMLLPVHPMPSIAGRPVVDVTDFTALAKLAERYGLLVLHWARSDVETFIVQDEGTTYRYRTGAGLPYVSGAAQGAGPAGTANNIVELP